MAFDRLVYLVYSSVQAFEISAEFRCRQISLHYFWNGLFSSQVGREIREANVFLRGKTLEQLDTMIPLAIHDNAGPFTKTKKHVYYFARPHMRFWHGPGDTYCMYELYKSKGQ